MFNLKAADHRNRKTQPSTSPHRQASPLTHKNNNKSPQFMQERKETPDHKQLRHRDIQGNQARFSLSSDRRRKEQEDFTIYLDKIIKEMTEKKEKLQKFIKIFNLMQNHNAQVRCLDHSNVLTIYCQTERKALCANCVYGINRHRTHKLLPLKDAATYIMEDNTILWNQINEDLKKMDESIKYTQDNTIALQKELKKHIKREQEEHRRRSDELKEQYESRIRSIEKLYEGLIGKSKQVERIIEEFKIKIWEILSKIGIGKQDINNIQFEVGKQVTCVSMASITNLEVKVITRRDLDKIHHKLDRM